ncbi:meiotic cell cortex C-terminal pleckstrin homology-domain-containing protein [Sporodiniella umbellata]|nr:meiotic cell cortex C-terminal pleckstrin homology-domain-containing protein [Sporodiniella umbellata]
MEIQWAAKLEKMRAEHEDEITTLKSLYNPKPKEVYESLSTQLSLHSSEASLTLEESEPSATQPYIPTTSLDSALAFSNLLSTDGGYSSTETWFEQKKEQESIRCCSLNSNKTVNELGSFFSSTASTDDFLEKKAWSQTIIGNWMWKYTRRHQFGLPANKHRRFFWIYPYKRTLYWSTQEPGPRLSEPPKHVDVISFKEKKEKNKIPYIVIKTFSRNLKIQCITLSNHSEWMQALNNIIVEK